MATMSKVETPRSQASESADPWQRAADAFVAWRDEETSASALVEVMTPVLWQVARAYDLDEEQARDGLQNVWLALVRSREAIADPQAIGAWLITATRREAWRLRTAARRLEQRRAPVNPEVELDHYLPHHRAAEEEALERSESRRLWRALAALPERCRRLLRVIAFSDRPNYAELAADLKMPVGSIGPTRGRCLGKLRTAMTSRPTTLPPTTPPSAPSR
ncbi:RNA polymerase sigma factor (sigma-70 family) [Serinibacter salmoneus]|uniref:RNA polymerase sigma factor (Sigma-70 family) n=1 Tax=Serinibacter salmoneus TaxID=556530 RepID=A0A2A9CWW7_9MICO|nr:RNA polymerase sigma factor (sigma-70 family) [Serinibacter salmoneus]